jgi:hypothetical protein
MQPTRIPSYHVNNDGLGPYAIFSCERCGRDYRSTPSVTQTVQESVKRGALGGLLRNIPIVGDAAANQVEGDRYRTSMNQQELAQAWGQVVTSFRECPTCKQVTCLSDFDEQAGTCTDDSPRAAEIEAAKAQQAAAALKGVADAFGVGNAISQGLARAAAAANTAVTCASCGTALAPGTKFCSNCGAAVAAPRSCASCGTVLQPDARFCPNCGASAA